MISGPSLSSEHHAAVLQPWFDEDFIIWLTAWKILAHFLENLNITWQRQK